MDGFRHETLVHSALQPLLACVFSSSVDYLQIPTFDAPFTIDDGPVPPLPELGVVDDTPHDITSDPEFCVGIDEEDGRPEDDLSDPELPDDNLWENELSDRDFSDVEFSDDELWND